MKRLNLLFAALIVMGVSSNSAKAQNINELPSIEVNGAADTLVVPNEIYIDITISENDNKKLSVEQQERKMYNAFKSLDIDVDKNLSTSDMISDFKSRFLRNKDVVKTKKYQLKVGDAMTAGKVFAALEDIGIANASIEKVAYSDIENMKNIIRIKAIQNAKLIAETLVKPLGQKVGKAIQIIDNNNNVVIGYRSDVRMYSALQGKVAGAEAAPKIDFEKIKISVREHVKFILE